MSGEKRCIECNRVLDWDDDDDHPLCEYCLMVDLHETSSEKVEDVMPETLHGMPKGELNVITSATGGGYSRLAEFQDLADPSGIKLVKSAALIAQLANSPAAIAATLLTLDFADVEGKVLSKMASDISGSDIRAMEAIGILMQEDYETSFSIGSYRQQVGRMKRDVPLTPAQRDEAKAQRIADIARKSKDNSYNTIKTHNGVTYELLKGEQRGLRISGSDDKHICVVYTKVGKKGYSFSARYLKDESKPYSPDNLSPHHTPVRYGVKKLAKYATLGQARTAARAYFML